MTYRNTSGRPLRKRQDGPARYHPITFRRRNANRIRNLLVLIRLRPVGWNNVHGPRHRRQGTECQPKVQCHRPFVSQDPKQPPCTKCNNPQTKRKGEAKRWDVYSSQNPLTLIVSPRHRNVMSSTVCHCPVPACWKRKRTRRPKIEAQQESSLGEGGPLESSHLSRCQPEPGRF